jgi:hypothetical protein
MFVTYSAPPTHISSAGNEVASPKLNILSSTSSVADANKGVTTRSLKSTHSGYLQAQTSRTGDASIYTATPKNVTTAFIDQLFTFFVNY